MPLDESQIVQQAMEALSVRTVIIYCPDNAQETIYEEGKLVDIATAEVYALCTPNEDGSWECTRYVVNMDLEPGFEAKSLEEAVERCLEEFHVDMVLVTNRGSWPLYVRGQWLEVSLEDAIALVQELDAPFATCQCDENGRWLAFPPGGKPDEEQETVTLR